MKRLPDSFFVKETVTPEPAWSVRQILRESLLATRASGSEPKGPVGLQGLPSRPRGSGFRGHEGLWAPSGSCADLSAPLTGSSCACLSRALISFGGATLMTS